MGEEIGLKLLIIYSFLDKSQSNFFKYSGKIYWNKVVIKSTLLLLSLLLIIPYFAFKNIVKLLTFSSETGTSFVFGSVSHKLQHVDHVIYVIIKIFVKS